MPWPPAGMLGHHLEVCVPSQQRQLQSLQQAAKTFCYRPHLGKHCVPDRKAERQGSDTRLQCEVHPQFPSRQRQRE